MSVLLDRLVDLGFAAELCVGLRLFFAGAGGRMSSWRPRVSTHEGTMKGLLNLRVRMTSEYAEADGAVDIGFDGDAQKNMAVLFTRRLWET